LQLCLAKQRRQGLDDEFDALLPGKPGDHA
jgi:hypothetical protein